MTSKIDKNSFFAGGVEAEKLIRADQQDLTKINTVLRFFESRRIDLPKKGKVSVVEALTASMKKSKINTEQSDLFYRLLSQYLFGLNREYEVDKSITPCIYHCGAFCTKNHLAKVGNYFAVCTRYGEDISVSEISRSLLSAVETNPEIDAIVDELVQAIPVMHTLEKQLLEEVIQNDADDDDDPENAGKKKAKKVSRKRKAAEKAEARIENGKAAGDAESESASEGELGEKEEAELVKKVEEEQKSKIEKKYEKACKLFGEIVVKLVKAISVNSIFTIVVSKFIAAMNKLEAEKKRALSGKAPKKPKVEKKEETNGSGEKKAGGSANEEDEDSDKPDDDDKDDSGEEKDDEDDDEEEVIEEKPKKPRLEEPDLTKLEESATAATTDPIPAAAATTSNDNAPQDSAKEEK